MPQVAFFLLLMAICGGVRADARVFFTADELRLIESLGPWPVPARPDPSNRLSGRDDAIAFGRGLFSDVRLSRDRDRACASCHQPDRGFTDGLPRSVGMATVDRNALGLWNLRLNRWYGWAGRSDNLWAQSLHPILDERELGLTVEALAARISGEEDLAARYRDVVGTAASAQTPQLVLVNVSKALAAYQETVTSPRTVFDAFRDTLLAGGDDGAYPPAAKRGLKLFLGRGQCIACHHGPNFTNGEFHDVGVSYFAAPGRVDTGRHGGVKQVRASHYNLLGPFSDDPDQSTAAPVRFVRLQHRNWGEFRVPSLRQAVLTAPYMHNGSLASLRDVVRHYSELNEDRLHADGERLLRALHLNEREIDDLVAFLETLSVTAAQ